MKRNGFGVSEITPCYGCEERKEACHAHCEPYANWNTRHRKTLDDIRRKREIEVQLDMFGKETRQRARRRK